MSDLDARTRWLALYVLCLASLMIVLDVDDRERRAAVDPGRPRLLRDLAGLGRQRLPAHLRRLPAARRPARRPLRPPAPVPDRHRRSSRWPRSPAGSPTRRCSLVAARARAGPRRRDRLGRLALADHEPLHRSRASARRRWASTASSCAGGGSIGVLLGGVLTDALNWHWIFLVNLPIGVAVVRSRCGCCPQARGARRAAQARRRRRGDGDRVADARGLRDRRTATRPAGRRRRRSACSARGRAARRRFLVIEARVRAPLMPLGLFRLRNVATAERRRRALGGGDVRVVLPLRALPAARARLQRRCRSASRSCRRT